MGNVISSTHAQGMTRAQQTLSFETILTQRSKHTGCAICGEATESNRLWTARLFGTSLTCEPVAVMPRRFTGKYDGLVHLWAYHPTCYARHRHFADQRGVSSFDMSEPGAVEAKNELAAMTCYSADGEVSA
jgi:hypothetical protein